MTTVLVTGANRGVGLAFAQAYFNRGCTVHVANRTPLDGELAEMAALEPSRLIWHFLDLSDFASIDRLGEEFSSTSIDLLVANAALTGGELGTFGETDYDRFERCLKANTMAPMRLAERLADAVANSELKTMFFLGSRLGAHPFYGYAGYMVSKTALNAVVMQVSLALKPTGITVAIAHPGWVGTDATGSHGDAPLTPEQSAEMLMQIIDNLSIEDTGKFFDPDGTTLPLVTQQTEDRFYGKPKGSTR